MPAPGLAMASGQALPGFLLCSVLLVLKMYALAVITGQVRLRKKVRAAGPATQDAGPAREQPLLGSSPCWTAPGWALGIPPLGTLAPGSPLLAEGALRQRVSREGDAWESWRRLGGVGAGKSFSGNSPLPESQGGLPALLNRLGVGAWSPEASTLHHLRLDSAGLQPHPGEPVDFGR